MVWNDEFNGAANMAPDPTRWTYDVGGGGWGNGELETYTNTTANSYQDGSGHLVIQALNNGGYSSARLKTQTLFDQAYGRVEASIQLPAGTTQGSGLWPAFWMLGSNITGSGWPVCGEIDIMENIGQYNTNVQNGGHIHGPVSPANGDYNGGNGVGSTFTFPTGQATNTAFHLYAVEWNPTSIIFYVDGTAYQTLTVANLPGGGQWVFNHPFFIIMNLAMGGGVGGPITCSFPQQLLVDYVRVYKLTSNGSSAYGGTPAAIPGTIQAENYDTYNDTADPTEPGEGFAYNGLGSTQTNGVFRTGDAVSTEACTDTGGGVDCDYTSPGQWLQYTVNVAQSAAYILDARVASSGLGGTFHFDVDGNTITGELTCPNTGGWQTWQDVAVPGISLGTGQHQLLLVEDSMGSGGTGVCNFNYFTFSLPSPTPTSVPTSGSSPTRSATPSFTRSATPSLSPTFTGTASPSATRTATSSPSRTSSPTGTATPSTSATGIATATPSATGTATPTRSATGTATATRSATVTATVTATATRSATATYTGSPTPTAFASLSPTLNPSQSPTSAATPTRTLDPTANASQSPTSAATQTRTLVPTANASQAPTALGSFTSSPTPNPSLSATPTRSSTVVLPSASPSPSATSSQSPTSAATLTGTLDPSPNASQSPTAAATMTSTITPVPTLNPSLSPTAPGTFTPTAGPTLQPSATPSAQGTFTFTGSPTPAASPEATPTPAASEILSVDRLYGLPNPDPAWILVHVTGHPRSLGLRLYSQAWTCVGAWSVDVAGDGWIKVPLAVPLPARGLFYAVATVGRGPATAHSGPARLYRLR